MRETAKRWLDAYAVHRPLYEDAATLAAQLIGQSIADMPVFIHSVIGRAKSVESASAKVKEKGYGRPKSQLTDVIGVRVITAYALAVDLVINRLRDRYLVDEKNSVDKRVKLGMDTFGYRSVHLIISMGKTGDLSGAGDLLASIKVEVQVRSLMEHAWAEAEHETRYKSGVKLSTPIHRRFSALAGALEIVDRELNALAEELARLVELYTESYRNLRDMDVIMDSARLLVLLAVKRGEAARLGPGSLVMGFKQASVCVKALADIGVVTAQDLVAVLTTPELKEDARQYGELRGIDPETISGVAVVALIVGRISVGLLLDYALLNDFQVRNIFSQLADSSD